MTSSPAFPSPWLGAPPKGDGYGPLQVSVDFSDRSEKTNRELISHSFIHPLGAEMGPVRKNQHPFSGHLASPTDGQQGSISTQMDAGTLCSFGFPLI